MTGGTGEAHTRCPGLLEDTPGVSPGWLGSSQAPRVPLASSVSPPCPPQAHNAGSGGPKPTDLGSLLSAGHPQGRSPPRPPAAAGLCVHENSRAFGVDLKSWGLEERLCILWDPPPSPCT